MDLILDARASQTSVDDLPTNTELTAALLVGVNVTQVDGSNLNTHSIGNFPADVRDWGGLTPALGVDAEVNYPAVAALHIHADVISADAVSAAAVTKIQDGLATAANLLIVSDGVGYLTSAIIGTISDAGTAGETYVVTFGGSTYTLDYAGLDATGNRTGVTRTKT